MMKRLILITFVLFLLFGCALSATVQDVEKNKKEGNFIEESYVEPLREVYDAHRYVINNSSVRPVKLMNSALNKKRFNEDDKQIICSGTLLHDQVFMIAFFSEEGGQTVVQYGPGAWIEYDFKSDLIGSCLLKSDIILNSKVLISLISQKRMNKRGGNQSA